MAENDPLTIQDPSPAPDMGSARIADDASMQQFDALQQEQKRQQDRDLARKSLNQNQIYTLYPDLASADQKAKGTSDAASVMLNLSYRLNKPLDEVRQNFQMLRTGYAQAQGWDVASSDSVFKAKFQEQFQKEDDQQKAIQNLQAKALQDSVSYAGKGMSRNPLAAFSEWDKEHGAIFGDATEAQKLKIFNETYLPVQRQMSSPIGIKAAQLVDALTKNADASGIPEAGADKTVAAMEQGQDATAQPEKIDPVQFLKGMSGEEQDKVLGVAAQLMATRQPEMGNGMKVAGGLGQAFAQGFLSYNAINQIDDLVDAEKRLKAAQTPEDAQKAKDDIENIKLAQKIKQAEQMGNTVQPELYGLPKFAYEAAQGVASMPGAVAPAIVPVLGEFAFYKLAQAQDAMKLMAQNPGMTAEEAKSKVTIASAAYGITMGRLAAIFGEASPGLGGFLKHTLQGTLVMEGAEAERILGRQLQSEIDPSFNPNEDYGTEWLDLLKSTPQNFVTLAAFGGMVKLIQGERPVDPNSAAELEKQAGNSRLLQYLGFTQETAEKVAGLPEGERLKALADEWGNRTPEQKQAGVELAREDAAKADQFLGSPDAPKIEQTPDGKYAVTTKDGDQTHTAVFGTEEGARQALEMELQTHVEKNTPSEPTNDWVTSTEEKEGGLTSFQNDSKMPADEGELLRPLDNTARGGESALALRTINASLASENKPERLAPASDQVVSQLSVEPAYQLADKLAGIFGKKIVFYTGDKLTPNGATSNALGTDRYIYLKTDGQRPHLFTLAHELWHHLERDTPELAKSLRKELAPLIKEWAKMNGRYKSYGYKPDRFFDEHIGDFLGDSFQNPDFLSNLRKRNPEAFADFATKTIEWLNDVLEKLQGWVMGGTDHIRDIEAARDMLAEGLSKYLVRDDSPIGERNSPQWWKAEPKSFGERQRFEDDPIIAYLSENPIRSRTDQEKRNKSQGLPNGGEYDGAPKLPPSHSTKIYGGNQGIDQAHQALVDEGYMPEDSTVDDLWRHIAKVSESAIKQTAAEKAEMARQRAEIKVDKELADLRENDPVEYRRRLAEMEPEAQKREEAAQAIERARRINAEDWRSQNNFQRARESDQQRDEAYDAAVKSGDEAEQQRLVDEAAKEAGYTVGPVYHGTPTGGFDVFHEQPTYFAHDKDHADIYQSATASSIRVTSTKDGIPETKKVFLKAENVFDTRNPKHRDLFEKEFFGKGGEEWQSNGTPLAQSGLPDWTDGRDLVDWIKESNLPFDAMALDEGGFPQADGSVKMKGSSIVVWKPHQIKSADPITRDDAGNIIPLSQRFNPESNDIRFQAARPEPIIGDIPPPKTMREQAAEIAARVASTVRDLPKDSAFKRHLLQWSARSQASSNEVMRVQHTIETTIKDKAKRDGITNWIEAGGDRALLLQRAAASKDPKIRAGYEAAAKFTPEEIKVAEKVRDTFNILEARAKKWGIDMGHRENYVPHVYTQEPQPPSGSSPKRLSEFFKFSQERTFESYFGGEQAGYHPQTKDISKLLGLYLNDMNNAINSRRFVAELSKGKASDGRPLVSPRGSGTAKKGEHGESEVHLVYPDAAQEGHEDYKVIDQPALHDWSFAGKDENGKNIMVKGDLAVHPEIADHFNNALGSSAIRKWWNTKTENPFLNATKATTKFLLDDLQSLVKGTMLSFSPFHQVQEGIHAIGHRVNPFANIPKIDLRDPKQADAAAHGLMLSHDRLSQSLFMEGVGTNNRNLVTMGLRKIGWGLTTAAADKVDAYQHWLFSQYIPGLKLKTYEHILERNMERFKSDIATGKATEFQVKNLSAQQANAAYGHLNYTEMGHNPTIRHAFQIALLAPDFLEARTRFVLQSAKSLAGAKTGAEQLQAFAFLAITQVVAATIQKVLTNGDPEWDHPFEMRFGNKYYGMRSVPEDVFKMLHNPTGFIGGRISPIFGRFIQEGVFGVNYRGERTSVGDAIADIMAGIVPMPMQSLTRQWTTGGAANPISPLEQILSSAGVQVHRYSPITKVYPLAHDWVKKNYPEDVQRGSYPVSKYQQLRYALEDNDLEAAKKEVDRLVAGGMKRADIGKAFKLSVNHPFTGSKEHDKEFYKSLDEDGKQRYDAAIERRKEILRRFMSVPY